MNNILKIMFDKLNREEKRKKILFINFNKKQANIIGIKNYYCLAICANETEYNQIIKNTNSKLYFDKISIFGDNIYNEVLNMKFDVIIGNPPYEGKGNPLYLQILEVCNQHANSVVWLCPTQWVKNPIESKFIKNLKENTCKNLISYEFIGNPFEDAATANEVGIFYFGNSNNYINYFDIYKNQFNNPDLAITILNKFKNYKNNLWNENHFNIKEDDKSNNYCVNAGWIRGHFVEKNKEKYSWDWTTLFSNNLREKYTFEFFVQGHHWYFNTKEECKNFVKSTETDICGFAVLLMKINSNTTQFILKHIPYLGDYTHEWTEEMIATELELTQEEVDYIHEEMKNYGWKVKEKNG